MSITILRNSASIDCLEDQGVPARPIGETISALSGIDVDLRGAGDNRCGIWECSPGLFERQLVQAEVMHILKGSCTFTTSSGDVQRIKAGDTVFFPENTTGVWEVTQSLRKVYVVLAN